MRKEKRRKVEELEKYASEADIEEGRRGGGDAGRLGRIVQERERKAVWSRRKKKRGNDEAVHRERGGESF